MEYVTKTAFTKDDIVPGKTLVSTIYEPSKFWLVSEAQSFSITKSGQVAHQGQQDWNNTRYVATGDIIGPVAGGADLFSPANSTVYAYTLATTGRPTPGNINPQPELKRGGSMYVTLADIRAIKNPVEG
jgi:hypothetical protein